MKPVVIVTGGSKGLGEATASWLVRWGAHVILVARGEETLRLAAARLAAIGGETGGGVSFHAGDVADPQIASRVVGTALNRFGRLDALVNNAGIIGPVGAIADVDPALWRTNVEVNLLGPFLFTREALPALRASGGRIINISTGAALRPIEAWSAYCAAKAGLTHFTRVLALEEPTVTALALRPGVVDTEMQTTIRRVGPGVMPAARVAYFEALKEKGRLEPPEVPGRAAAILALYAPRSWSGELIDYDDPRLEELFAMAFGGKGDAEPGNIFSYHEGHEEHEEG